MEDRAYIGNQMPKYDMSSERATKLAAAQRDAINKPRREDSASNSLERIESQVTQLAELCYRLEAIADRVDGGAPEGAIAGGPPPVAPGRPPNVVGSLGYINSRLGDKLGELQAHLSRIESALG